MKKLLFALLAIAVSPPLFAQESGTITSTQCVSIDVKVDKSTVGIQVTGTWSGTLQPQVSIQGQAAANAQVTPSTSTTPQATITGNGLFYANVGGAGIFQICGNTVSSGTANIFLNGSKGVNASLLGGGGSGSGTVSANNTAAGAVANYAAAAGSTTVGPTTLNYVAPTVTVSTAGGGNGSIALSGNTSGTVTLTAPAVAGTVANAATLSNSLTVNGPQVTVSVAGNGNGVLSLAGNTSGNATITAPAVAGTATNPILVSNSTQLPNTANVGYCLNGGTTECITGDASGNINIIQGGNAIIGVNGSHPVIRSNQALDWATSTGSITAVDTGLSRIGAAVVAVGNGTAANESGLWRSANTCPITADVSLTVNVANSFCSFSLPAVAKPWSFRCDIQWAITAGSGTNTFALGVNPSQTPTGTTNAEAQIYTATTGTQTMGSTAISASGADVILTGATYTPAATVQLAKISGTLLASGTAGTFAIQATANGTTATAAVKAGSACWLN